MPLPPRSYFFLSELVDAWGVSLTDLSCYAQERRLQISVMVIGKNAAAMGGALDSETVQTSVVLNGPCPIRSEDAWDVFRQGTIRIRSFPAKDQKGRLDLTDEAGLPVRVEDLLVTSVERERFESEYGLATQAPVAAGPAAALPSAAFLTHNADYSMVTIADQSFALGPLQASVVRVLHQAHLNGHPWQLQGDTLVAAGSASSRLVDLFKTQGNWRALLKSDNRGGWRLNLSDEVSQMRRAFRRPYLRLVATDAGVT